MQCPFCTTSLRPIAYEGIDIHTCDRCGGEFIAGGDIARIVSSREQRFPPALREALQSHEPVFGLPETEVRRELGCPACAMGMQVINYSGDSGVFVDRCPSCHGIWLDRDELERIQVLMERWADDAPEQIRDLAARLERTRAETAAGVENAFAGSRFAFVNALINRFLDAA